MGSDRVATVTDVKGWFCPYCGSFNIRNPYCMWTSDACDDCGKPVDVLEETVE